MDGIRLEPMATAPRNGSPILVKLPRFDIFIRVSWDGKQWMSGPVPTMPEVAGWLALDPETIKQL